MLRRLMTVLRKTLSLLAFIFICGTNGVSIFAEKPQSDTSEARVNGLPVSAQTTDHLLAEVARREPGFGGMFIGPDGVLRIYLLDESPAIVASAKEAIANVYGDRVQLGRIQALKGRYSFLQLKEWHDAMATVVLELPGVVLTDADETKNRLRIGVEKLEVRSLVEERLVELGIPLESVIFEETEPVQFATSLRDRHRPLVGGLQIVGGRLLLPTFTCTLGFNAVRRGVQGFVTASHCTREQGGVEGTFYHQPDISIPFFNVSLIGEEIADPAYFTDTRCPVGKRCRFSDSAFVRRRGGVSSSLGMIARPPLNSFAWDGVNSYRIVGESASPVAGDDVYKVGRSTGKTKGTVDGTCVDINVSDSDITLLCQSTATFESAPDHGDSGSPVVAPRCDPHDLAINRNPDNTMVASATSVQCGADAIIHLGADCQFNINDAGSGVKYLSGPAPIEVLSPQSLAGTRNPGDDIVPGVLEPIVFGVVSLRFTVPGSYVLRGFPTGFGSGDAGQVDVAVSVSDDALLYGILWGVGGTLGAFSPIANVQQEGELGPLNTCTSGAC